MKNHYRRNTFIRQASGPSRLLPEELSVLWEKFQTGDPSAISALYRLHVKELYNYGRQFAEHALVQDCIQDVFYELIRKRESLSSLNSVKAYLYACLRHRVLKQLKKSDLQQSTNLIRLRGGFGVELTDDPFDVNETIDHEQIDILKVACSQLTERQREAILLFYYEKLSYNELTKVMQLGKITSARILMHRAILSLRKILHQKGEK